MTTPDEYLRVKDGYLEVRVKLGQGERSKSGKSLVVYSTRGNTEAEGDHNGKPVIVGLNAYQQS